MSMYLLTQLLHRLFDASFCGVPLHGRVFDWLGIGQARVCVLNVCYVCEEGGLI